MLHSNKEILGCAIAAEDGDVGRVTDLYFDDHAWVVRYLVVETGSWLSSRRVLILPMTLLEPDFKHRRLPVTITREQVRNSPDIDTERPVGRQKEHEYAGYYELPMYWSGGGYWGDGLYPDALYPGYDGISGEMDSVLRELHEKTRADTNRTHREDPYLRSFNEVKEYHINATDGDIGHVHGVLIDVHTWAIRYLLVETGHWWHGHEVLVAPQWINEVDWGTSLVSVDTSRELIRTAPEYDPAGISDVQTQNAIHEHHRDSQGR